MAAVSPRPPATGIDAIAQVRLWPPGHWHTLARVSEIEQSGAVPVRPERRLAAILAADVVGYSGLMERDEEGTHERLKALLRDVFRPAADRHRGRVA